MKKNLQSKSHSAMRREILKDIVQWRKKEMAPKIKLTATQRRKLAKLEAERILKEDGKYSSEGAAREWSTVVDISTKPPSFKPVSLSSPRSPLSKTPKQVFFNPINIFDSFTHSITVL